MRLFSGFILLILGLIPAFGQSSTFPVNGVDEPREGTYAFIHATIQTDYKTRHQDASLLISHGKVIAAGNGISIPKEAIVIDLKGKFIYPSFIDLYSNYGMPAVQKRSSDSPKFISDKKGAYGWNEAVIPEFQANEKFNVDDKKAEEYRKCGFGAVLTHQMDGIARGSGSLVSLDKERENKTILKDRASANFSFSKGSSSQDYPSSLMGSIALLRQTFYDAQWYKSGGAKDEYNISLDYMNRNASLPAIFEANGKLNILRADKVGDEFNTQFIFKSNGDEYQRAEEIKATNGKLILSLNFPKPYDIGDPYEAMLVQLDDMKQWEMGPANPYLLDRAGIEFCFTSSDLDKRDDFLKNIRKAVQYGLSEEKALKALTLSPASFINAYDQIGSLENGKWANFIITSKSLFENDCAIYQNWVQGHPFFISNYDLNDIRGNYSLSLPDGVYKLKIVGAEENPEAQLTLPDSSKQKVILDRKGLQISLSYDDKGKISFPGYKDTLNGFSRVFGEISDDLKRWSGKGQNAKGEWFNWSAVRDSVYTEKKKEKADTLHPDYGNLLYPFLSYGNEKVPGENNYLIKNATVWTNEKEAVLNNTDVLVLNGKISKIGKDLSSGNAKVIDASGKYLTNGIIDEHSHICISGGVNEGTQASSAEVRIGDVINSEDINMYRQLSGGVIGAQLLHGSANPIGGQSALIKFRWGKAPEQLKWEKSDGFIKFALGENVKQSNWGDRSVTRYPQSRMGVEQSYMNYFSKARAYDQAMKAYRLSKSNGIAPRKDLELEALAEILNSTRFITCHSYVQSEINMLMHVADTFGFRVNTFTHILEGYKVADKMKAHGVNASTFSDWWAYKYEVIDAIPYNAYILSKMGVNTCINSDDAEMARRLNQEAAKSMKYGGLSEEEAWKMITLNPAKALHLDDRTGSIKEGKDADLVIWNANPLSIYASVLKTFVDGICYYDRDVDTAKREWIAKERARLIQKMIDAKKNGAETQSPTKKIEEQNGCMGHEGIVH